MNLPRSSSLLVAGLLAAGTALAHPPFSNEPKVARPAFAPREIRSEPAEDLVSGPVSYYSRRFAGKRTASGERFNPNALTMAHPTLPFGTRVRVSLQESDRSVIVRVNDRGPFDDSRVADVSPAAARILGFLRRGLADVTLEILSPVAESRQASSPSDH